MSAAVSENGGQLNRRDLLKGRFLERLRQQIDLPPEQIEALGAIYEEEVANVFQQQVPRRRVAGLIAGGTIVLLAGGAAAASIVHSQTSPEATAARAAQEAAQKEKELQAKRDFERKYAMDQVPSNFSYNNWRIGYAPSPNRQPLNKVVDTYLLEDYYSEILAPGHWTQGINNRTGIWIKDYSSSDGDSAYHFTIGLKADLFQPHVRDYKVTMPLSNQTLDTDLFVLEHRPNKISENIDKIAYLRIERVGDPQRLRATISEP